MAAILLKNEEKMKKGFSVCQFYEDDNGYTLVRDASSEEAIMKFVDAIKATDVKRVIILDARDRIAVEWEMGRGISIL